MTPQKRFANDGKVVTTVGAKASLLTSNQLRAEDTGSILLQEPFASV